MQKNVGSAQYCHGNSTALQWNSHAQVNAAMFKEMEPRGHFKENMFQTIRCFETMNLGHNN